MDLKMPTGKWMDQAAAWKILTGCLFSFLHDAIAGGVPLNFEQLRTELETWEQFIEFDDEQREKRRGQWDTARRLLWCAERAVNLPKEKELGWTELNYVCFALADTPEFIKRHAGWALDCIRILHAACVQRQSRPPKRSLHVPVALSDELLQDKGSLATLVLEVLQPGGGRVFHHPAYCALISYAHPDFEDSMQEAWEAAREQLPKGGASVPLCDGRWRLLQADGQPISEVKGRSASGAAAWGWWFVLQEGKVPDKEIIVLAETDRYGHLREVGGVSAKTKAIADDGRFDTIVVASDTNQRKAEDALRALGKLGAIRVKVCV